jgi:hypothetical protein
MASRTKFLTLPRAAVKRLQPHPLHQRRDVEPAHLDALMPEHIAQHPAAREWVEQVTLVDPPHNRQISFQNRAGQIVDAAPADPELPRLSRKR